MMMLDHIYIGENKNELHAADVRDRTNDMR